MASSADENEANVAQIDEINAHIDVVREKLQTLPKRDTDEYKETQRSLEDYYERLVQLGKYRNNTLAEIVRENEIKFRAKLRRWQWSLFLLCGGFLCAIVLMDPGMVISALDALYPYMTLDRIITNCLLGIIFLYMILK